MPPSTAGGRALARLRREIEARARPRREGPVDRMAIDLDDLWPLFRRVVHVARTPEFILAKHQGPRS